jgi:2,3-bisphosphoglycerate-independent phosphoglycerate mutase
MKTKEKKEKVILLIRDGWGHNPHCKNNSICQTPTPVTDRLMKDYPNELIDASGEAVGLPKGYQGNSEVGHMTIGSGRIIFQSLPRINKSIKSKEFFKISEFLNAIKNCKKNKSTLHLIGLIQVEGVHSHLNHLIALLDLCKKEKFTNVVVHAITDGRDSPVTNSLKHLKKLVKYGATIATISGRYYSMDRDLRWNRTKKAYDCIVKGECEEYNDPIKQIKACHKNKEFDEFIIPRKLQGYDGIKNKDSIIFFNFRTDRPRQLTKAIVEEKFEGFKRSPLHVNYVAMTQYYKPMNAKVAFKDQSFKNLLGDVVAKKGLRQLRISETEKYAHVTFFFNGQIEKPNKKENRILIPSPRVATYDLKPEMSAKKIKNKLVEEIKKDKYDLIVTNFVNGDMVGHTGIVKAIHKAVSEVDKCVGDIVNEALSKDYTVLIFADHGNCEDQSKNWKTSHTLNPVPLIVVSNDKLKLEKNCGLQDIAPTVLNLMKIKIPKEMTGKSVIK